METPHLLGFEIPDAGYRKGGYGTHDGQELTFFPTEFIGVTSQNARWANIWKGSISRLLNGLLTCMMEESRGLFELSVQQDVYPAPNDNPKSIDWLPFFAGFSWLAYGAQFSVVVTMAPSPSTKGETAMGGFFHEVLLTDCPKEDGRGRERVTSVGWAPVGPSLGLLSAVAGRHIYLYAPQGLSEVQNSKQKWPEVPLRWLNVQVLEHCTEIRSFAWTESGDGLLSVGSEIVMWQQGDNTWECLWRSSLEHPHTLCAASWFARGIAATAEGTFTDAAVEKDEDDHFVKVWWWEEGHDLHVLELSHPDRLLSIQWRPLRGFTATSQPFRPVLLTCCRDGVVRLWTEIGSFGANTAVDQIVSGSQDQFKLAFFVSAVIDVNSSLTGVLGRDIFITWPEARGGTARTPSVTTDTSRILSSKDYENASGEWLIGVGPSGSVTLWSVQSLDDLSPSRGQFVQIWQQKPGLLSCPSVPPSQSNVCPEDRGRLLSMKAVVHRPYGTLWGPPSSLEVFEIWSDNLLRWSCVWPHVSALGARSSVAGIVATGVASTSAGSGKSSAWGVSSEAIHLDGHRGNILQTAVHPDAAMRLVASLDDLGTVLFWLSSSSPLNPRLEIAGYSNSLWRLSGRLTGHNVNCSGTFSSMAWAPVAPAGADAVLLLAHPQGVDCYSISERVMSSKGKPKIFSISHSLICSLTWPVLDTDHPLQGIYTSPSLVTFNEDSQGQSCVVVGVGGMGTHLVSWKLDIMVFSKEQPELFQNEEIPVSDSLEEDMVEISSVTSSRRDEEVSSADETSFPEVLEPELGKTMVEGHLLGYTTLQVEEHVISMSVSAPQHISFGSSEGRRRTLSDFEQVFDVITGGVDGVLRLWKVGVEESESSLGLSDNSRSWRSVGSLRLYNGPVTRVAVCNGGATVASSGSPVDGADKCVHVWGADTFNEENGFSLEGSFVLPEPVVSLSWLEGGSGLSVLGVATQSSVNLFAQRRTSGSESSSVLSESGIWACLASSSLIGVTGSTLSWETQGSLVVTCEGHILIYSNCVWTPASAELCSSVEDISKAVSHLVVHDGFFLNFPRPSASLLPPPKNQQSVPRLPEFEHDQGNGFCSILEAAEKIGFSVLDYHPVALLSWLSRGYRVCARACVRHLANFLGPQTEPATTQIFGGSFSTATQPSKLAIPRTPLSKLLEEKEHGDHTGKENDIASFSLLGGQLGNLAENFLSSYSRDSLGSFSDPSNTKSLGKEKVTEAQGSLEVKAGGFQPFTKTEADLISRIIKESSEVPGLSNENEKIQLLALVDVLAEMDGVSQPSPTVSLDSPGLRFWLAFRYSFHYTRWAKELQYVAGEVSVNSKAMAWALHSEAKETLVDLCLPAQGITWSFMRALGMGFWYTDTTQLRKTMEKVARTHYLEKRDPKDCALLYVALDRRSVLAGLFKLSRDQRDKPLADFLARDFQEEKHKVAALKNAYVLMGKHRHELAAAFFILGQDINSAAVICAKNLGDPQLALTICLLLEGSNGPIGRDIILKYALPAARQAGDGWQASLLQWLLGKGIESIHELRTQKRIAQPPVLMDVKPSSEKDFLVFPLDPDVGSYCTLLAAKPRLKSGGYAGEAANLAKVATTRSTFALKRSGLSMHVLEYLISTESERISQAGASFRDINASRPSSTSFGSSSSVCEIAVSDATGREVGLGWVSAEVVSGIQRKIRASLALQCASQLLQDHPYWGGQTCAAWQNPLISKKLLRLMHHAGKDGAADKHGDSERATEDDMDGGRSILTFVEEADRNFDGDIKLLGRKYNVDVNWVVAHLSTFARIHHRPYLLDRLIQGIGILSEASQRDFHLATKAALSASAARYLQGAATEAPWVLARAVLACGGTAAPMPSKKKMSNTGGDQVPVGGAADNQGGVLSQLQMEELVRFGGEVQLFTTAANQENSLKEKGSRFMNLLSFVFFVAAAWLGRQTKTLLALVGPTVLDPTTEPVVPSRELDAVTWFRNLESKGLYSARKAAGKGPLEAFNFNIAGIVNITADDAWRVLGVSLWTHLLIYIKKQLTGTAVEVSYSSFGRVSSSHTQSRLKTSVHSAIQSGVPTNPVSKGTSFLGFSFQSSTWFDFKSKARDNPSQAQYASLARTGSFGSVSSTSKSSSATTEGGVTSETDEFDAALLGSLTSVVAGLRKELAAHLQHTLSTPETEPVSLWLWGKPPGASGVKTVVASANGPPKVFSASSSTGTGGIAAKNVNMASQEQSNLFPTVEIEMEDEAGKELWNLLVVREKVCSALGLEGVSGQIIKQEEGEMSGWYIGRKGSVQTTSGRSTGSDRDVSITGKLPPKRIMWNTTKDGTSVSCEGVGVSAQRQGASSHSRPQASVEGLHLSEEFSEWVNMRRHFY
ncbi:hypothetical protein R1flu_018884 [Riccia fluitans]|uniref:Ig-like domain-containing protein n=1 Tax=Riccia fluitans TaxID=41844 RepID=A0ABD1ZIM3_9MARC